MKKLGPILLGIALTGVGLVAGRFLAVQGAPRAEAGAAAAPAAAGAPKALPPQTLKSLGVVVGEAHKTDFVRRRRVQAVVVDRPLNRRPVVAPLGGIVTTIAVHTGQVAKAGEPLLTIARDPIPRPKPDLTASILTPVSETVHESTRLLRTSLSQLEVAQRELERIRPFVENLTVPRKTEIDLKYEVARHEQDVQGAKAELRAHGLTDEEIDAVGGGVPPPGNLSLWQRALERNGLWSETAEQIRQALPESQRDLPWLIAAIGELSAAGLATPELAATLAAVTEARQHFAEVASLLLDGTPLDTVGVLARAGALEPSMTIRAPGDAAPDWDVDVIHTRVGQRVDPGETLVALYDARQMWMRLQPVGHEIALVARALEDGIALEASPLLKGSGPDLDDVRLVRLALQGEADDRGGLAIAIVDNIPLPCTAYLACRSWQLRVGLRYLVEVPEDRFPDRFVLPAEALTYEGPTPVVFRQDGDTFRAQPVHVEYADDEVVVLADDGSLYEGDPVVLEGAFALGLALQQGTGGAVDPHAGHSH